MEVIALECEGVNRIGPKKFEKPVPENDAALLKVKYCGVCGTDMHGIEGKRNMAYPFIPGHEIVAVVDHVGEDASRHIKIVGADSFKPGDRVTINPRIVCGRCRYCITYPDQQELCRYAKTATSLGSGSYPHLLGGWAEYLYVMPGSELIKLPDSLDDEIASLIEPFACGVALADRYRSLTSGFSGNAIKRNDFVMVIGPGAIGLMAIVALKCAGFENIIAMGRSREKLSLAMEFGAKYTVSINDTDADTRKKMVMDLTDGYGLDMVAECAGASGTIGEGVTLLKRKGILFEVGHLLDAGPELVNPFVLCRNEIQLLGQYAYPSSLSMLKAAEILDKNEYDYGKLLKFFDYNEYEMALYSKDASDIKNVLKFS